MRENIFHGQEYSQESTDGLEDQIEAQVEISELVGQTEIGGFEQTELFSNEQIADHLRQELPITHLEGCPSISYEPEHENFNPWSGAGVLGFFELDSHEIKIGPMDRFESTRALLETVTHEVGHNLHFNLIQNNPELVGQWERLFQDSNISGEGFVSQYARTNAYEDFAETYKVYVHDPDYLQFMNSEKYEFMKNEIFYGREYEPN